MFCLFLFKQPIEHHRGKILYSLQLLLCFNVAEIWYIPYTTKSQLKRESLFNKVVRTCVHHCGSMAQSNVQSKQLLAVESNESWKFRYMPQMVPSMDNAKELSREVIHIYHVITFVGLSIWGDLSPPICDYVIFGRPLKTSVYNN